MFQFEADFVDSLRCIPMAVRLKLDTCGIKLKLNEWHQFTQAQRQAIVDLPCESAVEVQQYRQFLADLIWQSTGNEATSLSVEEHPAWQNVAHIPTSVLEQTAQLGVAIAPSQWANLSPIQRFALIKLSRSQHENKNFLPALKEFQLI